MHEKYIKTIKYTSMALAARGQIVVAARRLSRIGGVAYKV